MKTLPNVPPTNPINDPQAERKAISLPRPPNNSPINAPTKGPIIKEIGPKIGVKIPNINPMVLPHLPHLLPPNFCVPQIGK